MPKSSKRSPVVVDANIAVWAVVPTDRFRSAIALFADWRQNDAMLCAPALWLPECTSAIRQYVYAGELSHEKEAVVLRNLFELEVQIVEATQLRCEKALQWAHKLGQSKAYDGFYVALAEEFETLFYTADKRLANSARQAGAEWVRYVTVDG